MNKIKLENLTKTFQTENHTRTIFSDLNLEIPIGKITVVVGRSGCGKTTLLRMLAGEEQPDSGILRLPEGYRTTMLSPEPYLISFTSVLKNITLASGAGLTPLERESRARELAELVGLGEDQNLTPAQLSTGMKQRLALARALATRSQLLLMDEPFAALDFITRAELQRQLLKVQRQLPRTIVFVTHQLEEAIIMADRIVVIHSDGTVKTMELADLPVPRDAESAEFSAVKKTIMTECMK